MRLDQRRALGLGQILQRDDIGIEPFAIRMLDGDLVLDLLVANDTASGRVDQQHTPRLQTPLADHVLRRNRQHAGLRGEHYHVVVGDIISRGPETIAVERAANDRAISESD